MKIAKTAGNKPQEHIEELKKAGIMVIHKCTSVRRAVRLGRDLDRRVEHHPHAGGGSTATAGLYFATTLSQSSRWNFSWNNTRRRSATIGSSE